MLSQASNPLFGTATLLSCLTLQLSEITVHVKPFLTVFQARKSAFGGWDGTQHQAHGLCEDLLGTPRSYGLALPHELSLLDVNPKKLELTLFLSPEMAKTAPTGLLRVAAGSAGSSVARTGFMITPFTSYGRDPLIFYRPAPPAMYQVERETGGRTFYHRNSRSRFVGENVW